VPIATVETEHAYPAEIVWACAAAADRRYGGYRKESQWEIEKGETVEHPSSRRLILQYLELWRNNQLRKDTVTPSDYTAGTESRKFWQNQMLILLDNSANEYLKACVTTAHKDTIVDLVDMSIIASSIVAARREARKQALLEKKQCLNSQHVCTVGSNVIFDTEFEVIDSRYIDKVGASAVECIVEGNLYTWWSKTHVEPGVYRYLKGRVKDHNKDYGTGQPVTRLNYVKVHQ